MNLALNVASDSDSFEALPPREPHGVVMGIAALMAAATPTPTPVAGGVGCHRWRYALRWEQPSRLAILKNVLGGSVTTYTDYKAPGNGNQDDWPDPILHSELTDAWKYTAPTNPNGSFTRPYDHDCGVGLPACALSTAADVEGEFPGIHYSKGTWIWPDPGPLSTLSLSYDPRYPPIYLPGTDTTGAKFYRDLYKDPPICVWAPTCPVGTCTALCSRPVPTDVLAGPYPKDPATGALIPGVYDGWAWTLNYGYGAAPGNDIIYGPDPGPPFGLDGLTPALMDESTTAVNGIDSTPGITGTPLSFPTTWTTRPGVIGSIGPQTQTPKVNDPDVIRFAGLGQPSWTVNLARDVVFKTKDVVNWGLMTYSGTAGVCGGSTEVNPPLSGIAGGGVPVVTIDTGPGDVTAIEGYMRLRFVGGIGTVNWTPTKSAIAAADTSLSATWSADPKQACNRAYGVILCTDGQSNICNTGTSSLGADWEWDNSVAPTACEIDTGGTDFINFPPGAAEAMYLNAHQAGAGDAIVRARTFAIGISPDVSRCELNRTAYRGRTDANAKKKDAGFVLYDSGDPAGPARRRPPSAHRPDPRDGHVDERERGEPALACGLQPVRPGPGVPGQQGLRLLRERRPGAL